MIYDMTKIDININWQDLLWGYEHQFLGWREVVDYANYKVINGLNYNESAAELSMVDKETCYKTEILLKNLATDDLHYKTEKWLYIVLLDLFNTRKELKDPLGRVEEIYADFDYPEEIESFVRYMPFH